MVQSDVIAVRVATSGPAFTTRGRIRGYHLSPGGTAGTVNIYDNPSAASGRVGLALDVTTGTTLVATEIPGEGVLFTAGAYISLPAGTTITVFYA